MRSVELIPRRWETFSASGINKRELEVMLYIIPHATWDWEFLTFKMFVLLFSSQIVNFTILLCLVLLVVIAINLDMYFTVSRCLP